MTASVVTLTAYFIMRCIVIFLEPDSKSNIKESAIEEIDDVSSRLRFG